MRVLHVGCEIDPLRRRGDELLAAWPTLGAVAGAVHAAGAEVTVLQIAHADETFERDGVVYRFLAEPRAARVPGTHGPAGVIPWRLARAAAALRADVIHLNGLSFPLHARALAGSRRLVLVQDHGDRPPDRRVALHRWGFGGVAGVAFTAREQVEPFHEAGVLHRDLPVFEVPESSTWFTGGSREGARTVTGIYGAPALLWVGRLNENKDPLTILEALRLALGRLPDPHLWCCFGDAPLLEEVRARIDRDPELSARVHLVGRRPHAEMELIYRSVDFLLLGSRTEGSGYAVIEALACGVTPILSDIPAFRALTGRGAVGALVPRGDAQGFANALVGLASAPGDELRARAGEHFRRNLSFSTIGEQLIAAYREILSRADRGVEPLVAVQG